MNTKHLDGWLYVGVAVCTALTASFTSDDAKAFLSPGNLFALKTITGTLGAGFLAGKMYRSTTFAGIKVQDAKDAALVQNQSPQNQPPKSLDEKPN